MAVAVIAASFVVPTTGRLELIEPLLRSIEAQSLPVEVLLMDDGGSAELAALVQRDFPRVRYYHLGTRRGPAFQRNRGIELASSEFVFPIDDDTLLPSTQTVAQTLREFDDPRIAAVAIPYVNVRLDASVRQAAPDRSGIWVVHAFVGAAHAVRRSSFLAAGGYREHFFYMGEEGELSLRWLSKGLIVRAGVADPIEHLESPLRNTALADYHGRRNDILFAWHHVPRGVLAVHLAGTTLNAVRTAWRVGRGWHMLRGTLAGYADCARRSDERDPVTPALYRLHRRLKRHGPLPLSAIQSDLPPCSPC